METATQLVDLAERLLGKTTVKIISIVIVVTVANLITKKVNASC